MIKEKIEDLVEHEEGPNVKLRISVREKTFERLEKLKLESRFTWNEFLKDVVSAMEKENKKKKK